MQVKQPAECSAIFWQALFAKMTHARRFALNCCCIWHELILQSIHTHMTQTVDVQSQNVFFATTHCNTMSPIRLSHHVHFEKRRRKKTMLFHFMIFFLFFDSFFFVSTLFFSFLPFFLLPSFRRSWPFISPSFSPFLFQVLDSHISLFLPANFSVVRSVCCSISYMDCSVCCKFLMQFNPFVDQFFGRAFLLSLFCLSFLMEISPSEMHSLFSSFLLSIIHCLVLSCCR